jgi:hypothetical protein
MIPFRMANDCFKFVIKWIKDGGQTSQNVFVVFLINIFSFRMEAFPQEFGYISSDTVCSTGGLVPAGFFAGMFVGSIIGKRLFFVMAKQGGTTRRFKWVIVFLASALIVGAFFIDHFYDKTVSANVSEYAVASEARSKRIVFPDKYETTWHGQATSNWHNQWAIDVLKLIDNDVDLKGKANDACELLKIFSVSRIFFLSASLALISISSIEFLRAESGKRRSPSRSRKE